MGDTLLLKVKFVGRLGRNLRQLRRKRGGHIDVGVISHVSDQITAAHFSLVSPNKVACYLESAHADIEAVYKQLFFLTGPALTAPGTTVCPGYQMPLRAITVVTVRDDGLVGFAGEYAIFFVSVESH